MSRYAILLLLLFTFIPGFVFLGRNIIKENLRFALVEFSPFLIIMVLSLFAILAGNYCGKKDAKKLLSKPNEINRYR